MAVLADDLWRLNLAHVVLLDVSGDYGVPIPSWANRTLPTECYPVVSEAWLPRYGIAHRIRDVADRDGWLFDWQEMPVADGEPWYVGVVRADLGGSAVGR